MDTTYSYVDQNPPFNEFRTGDGNVRMFVASFDNMNHSCCEENRMIGPPEPKFVIQDRWPGGPAERIPYVPPKYVPPPPPPVLDLRSTVPVVSCHTEPRWPGGNPGIVQPPPPPRIRPPPLPEIFYTPPCHDETPCSTVYRWAGGNKEPKCFTPEQQVERYNNRHRANCSCRQTERRNSAPEKKCPERRWPGGPFDDIMPPSTLEPVICSGRSKFLNCDSCYQRYAYLLEDKQPIQEQCNKERGFRCPNSCRDKIQVKSPSAKCAANDNIPMLVIKRETPKLECKPRKKECKPYICKRLNGFDYCSQW